MVFGGLGGIVAGAVLARAGVERSRVERSRREADAPAPRPYAQDRFS
jgi:hypothetical protein